ncbi:MAG: hypothetical protein JST60_03550 [Chloroflexi bacterium SZAS-1]|jgi:hypothetical protein|nr:hypothetical protein [Chloroflexi bacterium SZAS-1]HNP85258.1 hypothetical protein [Kouleothrix sp.]
MDPVTYLTTFSSTFGALEWLCLIAQVALAVAGVYLVFLRAEPHPVRRNASRTLGYALLAVGALGVLFGALRLVPVQLFTMPIWFTIVTVLEVVLAAYAAYLLLSVLPGRVAAYDEANRKGGRRNLSRTQPALQANGSNGVQTIGVPRPPATTTRREARRDRKRRSK